MLGIRKFYGTNLDLWVGEPQEFECDAILTDQNDADKINTTTIQFRLDETTADFHLSNLLAGIMSPNDSLRHIAFCINDSSLRTKAKKQLNDFLSALHHNLSTQQKPRSLNRISFIFSCVESHDQFQELFFSEFPEE